VRDEIRHSWDYQLNPVTCAVSEVLQAGTGYCYAKSHLLAALLRANSIPAGLCYQRLSISDAGPPFCLHGLNAVYLPDLGWYRIDPRGNKKNVHAQFSPPNEQLAFRPTIAGEIDFPGVYSDPLGCFTTCGPAGKRNWPSVSLRMLFAIGWATAKTLPASITCRLQTTFCSCSRSGQN
jgi:transglutaminase-like putative cysteine protease